ncbi:MAG: 30S ribosomal protein S5 [Candidatus Yanofskybacteria bacterium]|nr:30S ribosomal protein S5 [Candidatus Yanofskybacteria bacterium]
MEYQKNNNNNNRGGGRGFGRGRGAPKEKSEFDSTNLDIARVARVTKGGKRFSFRATVVIGDGKGRVGVGVAQGKDVAQAMQKATNRGRKYLIKVPIINGTIPHEVSYKYSSAVVLLKPTPPGSGVKAGGPVRVVAKLAGIENLTAKLIERTNNKINIARATIGALEKLKKSPNERAIPSDSIPN